MATKRWPLASTQKDLRTERIPAGQHPADCIGGRFLRTAFRLIYPLAPTTYRSATKGLKSHARFAPSPWVSFLIQPNQAFDLGRQVNGPFNHAAMSVVEKYTTFLALTTGPIPQIATFAPFLLTAPSSDPAVARAFLKRVGIRLPDHVIVESPPVSELMGFMRQHKCYRRRDNSQAYVMDSYWDTAELMGNLEIFRRFFIPPAADYLLTFQGAPDDLSLDENTLAAVIAFLADTSYREWDVFILATQGGPPPCTSPRDTLVGTVALPSPEGTAIIPSPSPYQHRVVRTNRIVGSPVAAIYSHDGVARLLKLFDDKGPGASRFFCFTFPAWLAKHARVLTLEPPLGMGAVSPGAGATVDAAPGSDPLPDLGFGAPTADWSSPDSSPAAPGGNNAATSVGVTETGQRRQRGATAGQVVARPPSTNMGPWPPLPPRLTRGTHIIDAESHWGDGVNFQPLVLQVPPASRADAGSGSGNGGGAAGQGSSGGGGNSDTAGQGAGGDAVSSGGNKPGPSFTPLMLTAPSRREHAQTFLEMLGLHGADAARFMVPAPGNDPDSEAAKLFLKHNCEGRSLRSISDAATFLGHLRCIKAFLDHSTADFLVVFEDDAAPIYNITVENVYDLVRALHGRDIGREWDVLNLARAYSNCEQDFILTSFATSVLRGRFLHLFHVAHTGISYAAVALLYSRAGAQRAYETFKSQGLEFRGVCPEYDTWTREALRQLVLHPRMFDQRTKQSILCPLFYHTWRDLRFAHARWEDVFGGVSDLDSYYNRLRLPVWMRRYCAWMPVWSDLVGLSGARRKVWPWMLCWPMGNKLAVAVAQCVHQSVLYRCGPKPPLEASRGLSINMSALILKSDKVVRRQQSRLRTGVRRLSTWRGRHLALSTQLTRKPFSGRAGRTLCQHAKACLHLYYPDIVRNWVLADRLLAVSRRQVHLSALIIIAFQQYLRISEALGLRVRDVAHPGHPLLEPGPMVGALVLRNPKTAQGAAQHVLVRDPLSLWLLRRLTAGQPPEALLFRGLTFISFYIHVNYCRQLLADLGKLAHDRNTLGYYMTYYILLCSADVRFGEIDLPLPAPPTAILQYAPSLLAKTNPNALTTSAGVSSISHLEWSMLKATTILLWHLQGFLDAASKGDLTRVKHLLERKGPSLLDARYQDGRNALILAAGNGHLGLVKYLVEDERMSLDVRGEDGSNALHWAAWSGHLEVVKFLVEDKRMSLDIKENDGKNALLNAAQNGHLEVVKYLVEDKRMNLDIKKNDGSNVLLWAALYGHLKVVKYLVEDKRMSLDTTDNYGDNALHCAAWKGHLEVVKYLVEDKRMSLDTTDNAGKTPLDVAERQQEADVARYLREAKLRPAASPPAAPLARAESGSAGSSPTGLAYHLFLTHDWGSDTHGRDNHKRVALINQALKKQGFTTWFDEERMVGHIRQQMCAGIDGSRAVLVFVTARYMGKVNSDEDDNCEAEFGYALKQKKSKFMVPIVMEREMLDTAKWVGNLGMSLASKLYIPMVEDSDIHANMPKLLSTLASLGVTPKPM
eukprot:jgi/Mesvir1/23681/Mv18637-RA.1